MNQEDNNYKENLKNEIKRELQAEMEENYKKESRHKAFKNSFKGKLGKIRLVILVIIVIAIIAGAIFIPTKLNSGESNSKEILVDFGFKDVGFLTTQEWYGKIVEVSTKDRKLFDIISIPFTESKLIFSIDVEVLAGFNFEEIEYELTEEIGQKKVIIKLPHAYIYKKYAVENSFESYLDSESWFTNLNSTYQQELRDRVVEKGLQKAIDSGILDKADKNVQNLITGMIKNNQATMDYEVEFEYI